MSMDRCKSCDRLVDTDLDTECYYSESDEGGPCICEWCREEKCAC
jgi:hypothetical protein